MGTPNLELKALLFTSTLKICRFVAILNEPYMHRKCKDVSHIRSRVRTTSVSQFHCLRTYQMLDTSFLIRQTLVLVLDWSSKP